MVGNPLQVQGLGLHGFTTKGPGSVPGWRTKISQTVYRVAKFKGINKWWQTPPTCLSKGSAAPPWSERLWETRAVWAALTQSREDASPETQGLQQPRLCRVNHWASSGSAVWKEQTWLYAQFCFCQTCHPASQRLKMETSNNQISKKDSRDHQPKPGLFRWGNRAWGGRVPRGEPAPGLPPPVAGSTTWPGGVPWGLVTGGSRRDPRRVTYGLSQTGQAWKSLHVSDSGSS